MSKLRDKIGLLTRPKLKLVRGTRLTSALFIGVSALVAAGILWAANMYYDIDTGKIVVEEVQRMLRKVEINAPAGTTALEISEGNIVFSTAGTISQTGTGQVTFAGNVDATAGLDVTNAALTVGGTNFQVATSGVITWGGDTNLYRDAPNVLRTDDNFIMGANATTTGNLSVVGNVTIDGDLQFLGNQTISGTGTLTINPTGNLYLQSASYYVDENGFLTIAKVISPELEYSGNIIIDANSSTGNTTVTVTNQDGTYLADLVVEGDINVQGGRITLASGETIDAETANQVTINADGLTIVKSGGNEILRVDSSGVKITGSATTTNTLYITAGGARITGNVQISSGNLTVEGNVLPSADATYNLGSSSARWANLYSVTTTVGTASGDRIITNANTIQATGPLTVQFDDAGGFILQRDVAGETILVVESSGRVTLYSRGNQDLVLDASSGAVRIASGDTLYVDNIAIAGEGKIIGIIPIFGFDLPAQTASTSYVKVSRDLENYPFPATTTGTTRIHKLVFRYSASTTADLTWRIATTTGQTYSSSTLPVPGSNDLQKGNAYIA
ncbi:MAG: hypothetical protein QME68_06705, partial [Elusimicrobiota bacterium]|nr:hypothetical protein [Elusimicrobiota bacterium]